MSVKIVVIACGVCGLPIKTAWATDGNHGLMPGDYVLIADWVFHPDCWDAVADAVPPPEPGPEDDELPF